MHGDIKKGRPETGDAKQIIHDIRCDVALDWAQKRVGAEAKRATLLRDSLEDGVKRQRSQAG